MKTIIKVLEMLIDSAKLLGLSDYELKNARYFLDHQELGLCFDTIITQMYEYDIEIDNEFYTLIDKIGNRINLPAESYSFMKELIRNGNTIPKPVKDQLGIIINALG